MNQLRLAEPWERWPLPCLARRRASRYRCTRMALHGGEHSTRGDKGQWFFW